MLKMTTYKSFQAQHCTLRKHKKHFALILQDAHWVETFFQAIQADISCADIEIIAPACGHRNIWL